MKQHPRHIVLFSFQALLKIYWSSHIIVPFEFVPVDKLKFNMKSIIMKSSDVRPDQGSGQLYLMLNSERTQYEWMLLWGALHGSSSRIFYKIEINFFKNFAEEMHCHALTYKKRFSSTGTLEYLIICI